MFRDLKAKTTSLVRGLSGEEGQALAEYGLVLVLVSVACIAGLALLALGIIGLFQQVVSALP